MDGRPFLTLGVARRIALRGLLLGALLAIVPLLMGDPRLAWTGFLLGLTYVAPSLVERAAERRAFSPHGAALWSCGAALLAWAAITGVAIHGLYLQVDFGKLRLDWLDHLRPSLFLAPLAPAWVIGVVTFHHLVRKGGALGCGALIALEVGLLVATFALATGALHLVEGELAPATLAAAAIVAVGITAATAVAALSLIGFTVAVDALAERRP